MKKFSTLLLKKIIEKKSFCIGFMLLLSVTASHNINAQTVTLWQYLYPTGIGNQNQEIVQIAVNVTSVKTLTQINLQMTGTTAISDVSNIDVYYMGTSYRFNPATGTIFGSAAPTAGTIAINGSQSLSVGTHYFYVAYDVSNTAVEGNLLDVKVSSVVVGSSIVPSDVTGSRTILLAQARLARCGDDGSKFYRIPAITTCPDGSLLAAYDKRWNNGEDLGVTATNSIDIVSRRSTDGGKTWSTPVTVAGNHSTYSYTDPCFITDYQTGKIFCLMACGTVRFSSSTAANPIRIYVTESTDNGQSWSNGREITNSIYGSGCADATRRTWIAGVVSPGSGIQMSNGRLATAIQTKYSDGLIHDNIIYSDDHGVTWTCFNGDAFSGGGGNEAQIVESTTAGTIIMSIRHATNRYFNKSTNFGSTWGTPAAETEITEPGCNGDLTRLTTIAGGSDKNRLLQSIPFNATMRTNISVMLSNDEGTNWPYRKVIYPDMGATSIGSAYSTLCVLPDNTIGLLYELSDTIPYNGAWAWPYEQIHFVRFSLNWLTGGAESLCQPTGFTSPTSNSPQCTNSSITFTQGTCPTGYTCYWQTTADGVSTANSASTLTVTQGTPGNYTAYVRGYNGSCWTQALSTVGSFMQTPTGVTSAASDNSICVGDAINLTSSATNTETLISPTVAGGFDPGTTFAANGWTAVNSAANTWYCGAYAGAYSGTNSAYIGTATSYVGTGTTSANHIYRDIAIPAGSTNISLKFYLKMPVIHNGSDYFRVYTTTTGYTPVAGTTPGTGYTQVFSYTTPALSAYTLQTVTLPDALAGTTVRLVFTYSCNNATTFANPSIDNISLTANKANYSWTSAPAGFTSALQNPTGVTPAVNTTYTVTATATNGCSETASTAVTVSSVTPSFTQLGPYCTGDVPGTLPTTSLNGITGTWSPSSISTATAGIITYTFTPTAGQCASVVTMDVTVNAATTTPTFTQAGPYCVGATPAALPTTSTNSITGTWSPATISTASAGSTVYTFTPTAGQCATTATMTVVVNSNITPTFTQAGPYCVGATPAALPTTSTNSITGTWSPATISTASAGSTVYTFTPTAGQCATTTTMTVVVNANVTPTFAQAGPYCVGATPAALPTTSTNSITGTWSPATISTASEGSTVYTFTPTAGQCATTTTMTVVVNANVTPTFAQAGPYCVGATPASLPTTSTNSINGTWSPATISTASAGSTVYTFTPTAGQCATTATMTVVVNANVTPTFAQAGPYCVGATPAVLPTTSTNSITGTWSPATISTASAGSTVYTFTPTAGQCATTTTMTVVVNANVTPTFAQAGPYCVGATPASLPTTSTNSINGTWSPATISTASAGSTVYTFTPTAGQCATTATMTVVVNANVTPTFAQAGPYCVGATPTSLPTTSTNSITGTWSPATISTASEGSTVYTFTPTAGQCATTTTMTVVVNANVTPTFAQAGPYCVGATPAALPTTSTNSITGTWSPATISTASAGSTVYTFTPTAGQCATTTTMTVVVNTNVTPTFAQAGPYCVGATPAALPTTSANSITGNWSPATISTASEGSTVYTFTPTAGQCATTTTMTVVVNANVTPTFAQAGPYCVGATPAALPTTSTNSITGTWSPATISTASAGSTVYTFTPTAGQCATTTTMTVMVNANVTPTFTQAGPYCVGVTPAALPTTSTNSITGTWSPATISTASAGSTVYTFTPTAGQCATTTTMTVVVNANVTPTFAQAGPYCVGATPASLPTTSTNSITGTWSPATISTASEGSTVYTFTPTAGQCATTTTMTVVVNANVTPTFAQAGPYCVGATPAALPTTSANSITGTWSPATISTASEGSTVYTFTPTAGQCATTATMTVVVNANVTPTFAQAGPYCVGATPSALPTTSTNSITGTWSPATISTASAGSTVYTFTPTVGQCATTATMTVVVNSNITPTFTQAGPYCVGATPASLPTTSTNSITGTWSPATISTASAGSTMYTFTPTAGQCATTATMTVVVNANVTPTFTQAGPYCVGATPASLPTTSTNSINGTWSPATISTASAGSTVYTFTPTAGQCATTTTMTVVVNTNVTPTFAQAGPYCVGATPAALPTTSANSITGTWSPATISTASAGSTVYTFTPTAGQCATTTTMTVVVNANVTPTFAQAGPYCVGATPASLPTTSTNSITGTWSPATISTASAGSTVYTFTPTAGQCATTATMTVVVNANVTPTFTQAGPYCVGATPASLPTTSTNSITGTWSPATISTASAGSTVYTFTPTAGQCATTATMTVVVNANVTPTFTQAGPYCVGATPASLPTTSTNSITGTWSPSTISTASAGSTVYTFTPTAGQCAITATMTVVVNANLTPTFTQAGPYCVGATPAALPTTSTNSITGTWSPATISTASAGSTVYTFTPTAGQCATTTTMTVMVNANVTPTFTQAGPYCVGATPAVLPTTSTNSINGTWSPATISTASAGSTVYTFTPTAGQCATTKTMTVVVNANVTPTFAQAGPYCVGATPASLPTTSTNSINGTWSPATISTASAGSTVYTFTPTAGQCATTTTMTVVVNPVYAFSENHSICNGDSYTWHGTSYTAGGTYTAAYTTVNGCDSIYTLNLTVNPTYAFNENHSMCNGDSYTWHGTSYSAGGIYTAAYTTVNGCDSIYTLNLTVNPTYAFSENHSICNGDSYTWHGNTYTAGGTYTAVYATVNGCDSVYTLNLTVNSSYTFNESHSICQGETYTWHGADYSAAGTYHDNLQTMTGCDSTYVLDLTVNNLPVVWLGNDTTICANSYIILDAGNPGASYIWSEGSAVSQTILIDSISHGVSTFDVWVSVDNGCTANDTISITIDNCDLIDENGNIVFSVFPNPADGVININASGEWSEALVEMTDVEGKLVYCGRMTDLNGLNSLKQFDLGIYPAGVYFMHFVTGTHVQVIKVVRQ